MHGWLARIGFDRLQSGAGFVRLDNEQVLERTAKPFGTDAATRLKMCSRGLTPDFLALSEWRKGIFKNFLEKKLRRSIDRSNYSAFFDLFCT